MLERIATQVRKRLEEDRLKTSAAELFRQAERARTPWVFTNVFEAARSGGEHPAPRIIAEVKLASPSEGAIAPGADPIAAAGDYLKNGAAALSVLTERDFFSGSPDYLRRIREAHPDARLLMKDFVIDEYQIAQARVLGADAILLILALIGPDQARAFDVKARSLGLSCLFEVHDESELQQALDLGAELIGVNNRNLKSMQVSVGTSVELAKHIPADFSGVLISESGLRSGTDIKQLARHGYRGFLIGTHFMKSGHPGQSLAALIAEAGGAK